MDWSTWWLGSRTQWNVTKDFYLGVDVMYAKLHSADLGLGTAFTPAVGGFANSVPKTDVGQLAVPLPRPSRFLSLT